MERGRAAHANQPHQPMKNPKQSRPGFTLIEMLVTITIIVILAGLSLGGFKFVTTKQANSQAAIQIKLLEKAIEEYKLDNGVYPGASANYGGAAATGAVGDFSQVLYTALFYEGYEFSVTPNRADLNGTKATKIYLADLDPVNNKHGWLAPSTSSTPSPNLKIMDPWGNNYIYRTGTVAKNPDFDLLSNGQDGATDNNGPKSKDDHSNY